MLTAVLTEAVDRSGGNGTSDIVREACWPLVCLPQRGGLCRMLELSRRVANLRDGQAMCPIDGVVAAVFLCDWWPAQAWTTQRPPVVKLSVGQAALL